jgi:hypothetical protein
MKKLPLLVLFITISISLSGQSNTASIKEINEKSLKEWINYLASDQMKGRLNGSPEMDEAANWLSQRFKEYGIVPFKEYPDYFQKYETTGRSGTVNEKNVIGFIPGTDPSLKNEYLILTAHFDHIGIRSAIEGDSIYNGADDNAAGTSTLIAIAKYFYDNGIKPGRTIIIAAVSGEEIGLRGSRYLVKNMPVPVESLYANLNFEMIGHSEYLGTGKYYMTGTDFSNLDNTINRYIGENDRIALIDTIAMASRLFYMSDNAAFARLSTADDISVGVPCGTFATTTFGDHIHHPGDEASLFDFENMALLVNHFAEVVKYLSDCRDDINWTDKRFVRPEKVR